MMEKPDSIVRIPCSLNQSFFVLWLTFLKPLHKLTDREIGVLACFIYHKYELGKVIKDDEILDKVLMSEDTKKTIKSECNLSSSHFQVIMNKLKKVNAIANGKVNRKFIPDLAEDKEGFAMLLHFDFKNIELKKL